MNDFHPQFPCSAPRLRRPLQPLELLSPECAATSVTWGLEIGYPKFVYGQWMTRVGKCPSWTSPKYWGYHLQQILFQVMWNKSPFYGTFTKPWMRQFWSTSGFGSVPDKAPWNLWGISKSSAPITGSAGWLGSSSRSGMTMEWWNGYQIYLTDPYLWMLP